MTCRNPKGCERYPNAPCSLIGSVCIAEIKDTEPNPAIPKIGSCWRHSNGNEYEVIEITNLPDDARYPLTISYRGSSGQKYSRFFSDWYRSMTLIADAEPTDEDALIDKAKRAAKCIYLATDKVVADDISAILLGLVQIIEHKPAEDAPAEERNTEPLEIALIFLRGALDCHDFQWDGDQREAAEQTYRDAKAALALITTPAEEPEEKFCGYTLHEAASRAVKCRSRGAWEWFQAWFNADLNEDDPPPGEW